MWEGFARGGGEKERETWSSSVGPCPAVPVQPSRPDAVAGRRRQGPAVIGRGHGLCDVVFTSLPSSASV